VKRVSPDWNTGTGQRPGGTYEDWPDKNKATRFQITYMEGASNTNFRDVVKIQGYREDGRTPLNDESSGYRILGYSYGAEFEIPYMPNADNARLKLGNTYTVLQQEGTITKTKHQEAGEDIGYATTTRWRFEATFSLTGSKSVSGTWYSHEEGERTYWVDADGNEMDEWLSSSGAHPKTETVSETINRSFNADLW
jgi:hypothetical protein